MIHPTVFNNEGGLSIIGKRFRHSLAKKSFNNLVVAILKSTPWYVTSNTLFMNIFEESNAITNNSFNFRKVFSDL